MSGIDHWFLRKKWFRILITLILVALLIYMVDLIAWVFDPIWKYIAAIALPFLLAGFLFYITKPVVNFLTKFKINRVVAILLVFLLIIGLVTLASIYIAPTVQNQFTTLINNVPSMVDQVQSWISYWQQNRSVLPQQLNDTINNFANNLGTYTQNFSTGIINILTSVFSILFALVLTPFFLFFMLKDGHEFVPYVSQFLSAPKSRSFKRLSDEVNHSLESFIQGQFLVSLFVGICLYIGYVIIGLQYSLSLALLALFLNVIPFLGPFLAATPAVLVGLLQSPMMAVWVLVVFIIVQQLEGNLISPNVMGRALHIHPLTIITLIMAAGAIAGFIGLLLVIPAYAVAKAVVYHFYKEWQRHQPVGEKEIL